ncbi:MAG: T9SS C-terminal target domain-containing protein, partial [Aquaticitalea sp.]
MKKQITLLIALCIAILTTNNSFAQLVTSGADDGTDGTLRNEIADTPAGGIILFAPSVTVVKLNSELLLDKSLTISGTFGSNVVIDADEKGRAFNIISGPVVLNSLTLMNGLAPNGGAIYITNALVTVNSCLINANTANAPPTPGPAGSGGGIFNDVGGILVASNTEISSNIANRAGGGIEDKSGTGLSITLLNVNLMNNHAGISPASAAPGNGGALHVSGNGSVYMFGGKTTGNLAANEGGGLWNGSGLMTVIDHTVDGNTASGNDDMVAGAAGGGGIYNEGGMLDLSGSTAITNNSATGAQSTGGGILNSVGTLTANGITIKDNTSNRAGGGIETNGGGAVTLTNVRLNSNDTGVVPGDGAPGNGGGLHVSGNSAVTVTGGKTNNNTAANEGGGLWNGTGLMTVSNHTISGNIAAGSDATVAGAAGGGGIYNEGGMLNLSGSTMITNNSATGAQSTGGGILNSVGTLTANGITIRDNTSNRAGGGIETNGGGAVTLTNVRLNSNDTGVVTGDGAPGNGGGLHVSGNSTVNLSGGTTNNNTAANEGGGLWNGSGLLTVVDHTVNGNTASGNDAMV